MRRFTPIIIIENYNGIKQLKQYSRQHKIKYKPTYLYGKVYIRFNVIRTLKPEFIRLIHSCDKEHDKQFNIQF